MKKWMITNLNIYKNYGLNYEWYIEFRIWDEKFYCDEVNKFIKDIIINKRAKYECIINDIRWVDFYVYNWYNKWDWGYVYEIEINNSLINPNKITSFLET